MGWTVLDKPMKTSPKPPKGEPKWIRYEAQSWLVLALRLSPLAELAHRRLADLCWSGATRNLDSGPETAELCKVPRGEWRTVLHELRRAGWRAANGTLRHPAVGRALAEARQYQRDCQRRTAAATGARWAAPSGGQEPGSVKQTQLPSRSASRTPSRSYTVQSGKDVTVHDSTSHCEQAEPLTFSPSQPEKAAEGEAAFMAHVLEAFSSFGPKGSENEIANWGGWWRNRYREDKGKARRVLAEIRGMVREGRIRRNPGAAANDLWKRFAPSEQQRSGGVTE
jgi:hypothetical protein